MEFHGLEIEIELRQGDRAQGACAAASADPDGWVVIGRKPRSSL